MSVVPTPGAVPAVATSEYIGRQADVESLEARLFSGARLITLIGPGGIGKTRLAAEALRRAHRSLHLAVYWVGLAELGPESVTEDMVRSAIQVDAGSRPPPIARDGLPYRKVLVLDNCEHVLAEVGRIVGNLLADPELTILATSREPIRWVDEHIVPVPPLSAAHSLALLRRRAELTGRPIPEDPEPLRIAELICRHVDYNPLFIRLAAARLRYQPPAVVLRELTGDADDKRLQWSHGARAGADARHRGVYDVIAWSFALCGAEEQLLLERLSVFAAGCETDDEQALRNGIDLDTVVAVCADDELPPERIEPLLERLAERSLVSEHLTATAVRWYVVESVRVFARARLQRRERDAARTTARHRRYFRDEVAAGQSIWHGEQAQDWHDRMRAGWDNILLAVETGLADPGEAVVALETATGLLSMWIPYATGGGPALTRLTESAVDATRDADPLPTELQVRAMALLAWVALWQGRSADAARLLDACATAWLPASEAVRWRDSAEEDLGLPAPVEWIWGLELFLVYADPRAIGVLERSWRKSVAAGDVAGSELSSVFVALAAAFVGDREAALDITERILARSMDSGSVLSQGWARLARAVALVKHGAADAAAALTHGVLAQHLIEGDIWTVSWAVGARIMVAARILLEASAIGDETARAAAATEIARLVEVFRTCHRTMGTVIDRVALMTAQLQGAADLAAAVLDDQAYASAAAEGARVRPEFDALRQFVLDGQTPDLPTPVPSAAGATRADRKPEGPQSVPSSARWNTLSRAERDVAVFAAAGWSNRAIADHRQSSVRTVDAQVATIRQKLMTPTRAEIAHHIPEELAERVRRESECRPARAPRRRRG
ncbi:ATP-binding protein [Nocardia mexicana]|uniref:Putative ATPase n=1 Tax=Nocardia mexicana TaxID=279262 RepID=A0A370HCS5_9NOCA|nr:LuxR C-terminal-related transcriptional regulator [Nocardia mexicana]RDI54517.1 putative ATPase [Nocardia mexicana]